MYISAHIRKVMKWCKACNNGALNRLLFNRVKNTIMVHLIGYHLME